RNATEYPASEVEHGAVARAEEAAFPVRIEILWLNFGKELRGATEVSTDTHYDHDFWFARTELVLCISRLLFSIFRLRVGQMAGIVTQVVQRGFVASHHEDGLTAPRRH